MYAQNRNSPLFREDPNNVGTYQLSCRYKSLTLKVIREVTFQPAQVNYIYNFSKKVKLNNTDLLLQVNTFPKFRICIKVRWLATDATAKNSPIASPLESKFIRDGVKSVDERDEAGMVI